MGKLSPKLQLSFLNSIQICRPKDISSLVTNPLPHFSQTHEDILFPSFQQPPSPPKQHHKEPKLKAKLGESNNNIEEGERLQRGGGVRTRRFKRFGSKEWKDIEEVEKEKAAAAAACMVDRKVNESFVVMKRSVDPCRDFKKSMLEMIVEKQIFEPKELEHLLMSFLSLNSTTHHRAILKAFTQIWKEIFSASSN